MDVRWLAVWSSYIDFPKTMDYNLEWVQLVFHQFIFLPEAEMKLGQPPISQKCLMDNKRMKTNKQTDVKDWVLDTGMWSAPLTITTLKAHSSQSILPSPHISSHFEENLMGILINC